MRFRGPLQGPWDPVAIHVDLRGPESDLPRRRAARGPFFPGEAVVIQLTSMVYIVKLGNYSRKLSEALEGQPLRVIQ